MFAIAKLLSSGTSRIGARHALLAGAAAIVVGGAGIAWLASRPAQAVGAAHLPAPGVDAGAPAMALVFVSGAVVRPGLYRLSSSARIADAIAAAGGLLPTADPGKLPDMAGPVHEGKQVNVPFLRSTSGRAVAARIDINTATLEELQAIPSMPYGLAEAIVDYREQFGGFRALSELRTMLGVDGPTVTGLRPYLYVAPVTP